MKKSEAQKIQEIAAEIDEVAAMAPKKVAKTTKSARIVKMWKDKVEIADIATQLGIRYEFAYQVSKRFALANGLPFTTNKAKGVTKADKIRQLYDEGKSTSEIAKTVGTYNSYVWQTIDLYKKQKVSQ